MAVFAAWLVLVVGDARVWAKPGSAARQYVFSRSTKQTASNRLGVTGVPAFVVFADGQQRRGIYVTGTLANGLWRSMSLRPGTVLLTLDGKVVEQPTGADSYLSGKASGQLEYTYVAFPGGVPRVVTGRTRYWEQHSVGEVSAESVGGGKRDFPSSSVSELEGYGVQLINESRKSEGVSSVAANSALSALARKYAEYMVANNHFSHRDKEGRSPQVRAQEAGIKSGVYENLSFATRGNASDKDLILKAHEQMMAEPKGQENHRYNIVHPDHQYVGVGVARSGATIIMVHEFCDKSP